MHLVHILKLCIITSLAGTIFVGIMFMIRTADEDDLRSHVKGAVYRNQIQKSHSNQAGTPPTHDSFTLPTVTTVDTTSAQKLAESVHTPSVHIFYYPWFGNPEFDDGNYYHWNHPILKPSPESRMRSRNHTPPGDLAASFYPQLGPYSSRNPAVIDRHMRWLSSAAVDVVALSWYPKNKADAQGHPWDMLVPALLNAAEKYKLKMTFHLEPYEHQTAATVRNDIDYVVRMYGNHPAFYRTSPKNNLSVKLPLFYVYDSYKISNADWQNIASVNGSSTIRGTDIDSLLIGLAIKLDDVKAMREAGFDGVYTYFAADGFTEVSSMKNWAELSRLCTEHSMLFIPSIGPGYDDSKVRPWNGANTRGRDNGAYYKRHFEMAHAAKADLLSITSFNEWHEGTQIEPAIKFISTAENSTFVYQEYGKEPEQYLQLTHKMIQTYFVLHHENIPMNIARIV